jgi:plasmid stabilization system protein ParE
MAKRKRSIEWSFSASLEFTEILEELGQESESAVFIVGNAILEEITTFSNFPEAHPLDRFKKKNDGKFRASTVYSYRISYYVEEQFIYILRIRHTSREPLEH